MTVHTPPPSHTPPPQEEGVTLTIDGQEITVEKGTLIIRAAERLGIVVPRFCDHPLLDPAGACRQCIVEVEGQGKPMTSCTTPVQDDMVVKTHLTSEMAEKAQEAQLEFLLINHPLDCPMCDKGGECPLQDQALAYGPGESRFVDEKRRYEKPVAVSPNVLLDRERCVLCARCTRFARQISGRPFIELFERGALQQVAIFEDEPYFDYFSGNIIQICPVGALTSATYRFRARPFDLVSKPSVCDLCSAGCNLNVHTRRDGVMRIMARTNMEVNEAWNCDKGRFAFKYLEHSTRVLEPEIRREGGRVPTSWTEALDATADALRDVDPSRVAVLTGGRLPDEDAYVLSKFARTVLHTDNIDFRTRNPGRDEATALAAVATRPTPTYEDVEWSPVTLLVDLDPEEEVPILFLRLRKAWLTNDSRIVSLGPRAGTISELLWRRLQTAPGGEAALLDQLTDRLPQEDGEDDAIGQVAENLREAGQDAVILVGERGGASPGALAAAGRLAEACGAKLAWVPRRGNARGALDAGLLAGLLPGGRRLAEDAERDELTSVWEQLPDAPGRDFAGVLEAAAAGEIDVLYLVGVDPLRDADRPELARRAFEGAGTVIAQDLLASESVRAADIVLPVTATHERHGTLTNWEGRRQRFSQAVTSPTLALDDWDVLSQLALRLGRDLGFRGIDDIRAEMAQVGQHDAAHPWGERDWRRKQTALSQSRSQYDETLTVWSYPLLLDLGTMSVGADDMLRTAKRPFAALNTEDAERLGIDNGQPVLVSNEHARLAVPAQVEDDVAPGTVFLPSNSTDLPASALAGDGDGEVRVRIEPAPEMLGTVLPDRGGWVRGDAGLTHPGADR